MRHKWDRKLNKRQRWCQCLNCGIIKETDFYCGQIYIRDENDGGQSDKMWFGKAPPCYKIEDKANQINP